MYDRFQSRFVRDAVLSAEVATISMGIRGEPDIVGFLRQFGGASFNGGLYRIITSLSGKWATEFVATAFPEFGGRTVPFGYDWLGRVFALDSGRVWQGSSTVIMFEPGTAKALEIPCNLQSFHNDELTEYADEALATGFYARWVHGGGSWPSLNQCVGYRKPLFLGGQDTVVNLEIADLAVYWSVSGELIEKTRGLSPGTRIGNVTASD